MHFSAKLENKLEPISHNQINDSPVVSSGEAIADSKTGSVKQMLFLVSF